MRFGTSAGGTHLESTLPTVVGRIWRGNKSWIKRFVVSEQSMLPTLQPGDGVVAIRSSRLRRGQIRCFDKRITSIGNNENIVGGA